MAEAIVEPIVDIVAEKEEPAAPVVEEKPPEPKKKGRPAGAKDRAPRKKKITIVEEPLEVVPDPPEPVEPAPKARAKAAPKAPPEEPPTPLPRHHVSFEEPAPQSPRTMLREASKHILNLRTLADQARRAHLQDIYTKKLHSF